MATDAQEAQLRRLLQYATLITVKTKDDGTKIELHFTGETLQRQVKTLLTSLFPNARISLDSDTLDAANLPEMMTHISPPAPLLNDTAPQNPRALTRIYITDTENAVNFAEKFNNYTHKQFIIDKKTAFAENEKLPETIKNQPKGPQRTIDFASWLETPEAKNTVPVTISNLAARNAEKHVMDELRQIWMHRN
jgi:hypothetical protein